MSFICRMVPPPPDLTLLRMMPASFDRRCYWPPLTAAAALVPTKLGLEMKALLAVVKAALDIS